MLPEHNHLSALNHFRLDEAAKVTVQYGAWCRLEIDHLTVLMGEPRPLVGVIDHELALWLMRACDAGAHVVSPDVTALGVVEDVDRACRWDV